MHDIFHPLPDEPTILTAEKEALLATGRMELPPSLFNYIWDTLQEWIDQEVALRASVGSTEASNGRLARVGRIDRSKLGSIDFGIVGSGALRPDSGAASLLR